MSLAYLSLGGNVGDRRGHLRGALEALRGTPGVQVVKVSQVYETEPVGVTEQPKFLNLAVELATTLEPRALLARCLEIEKEQGRVRSKRWGPRTVDLDLLWYDGREMCEPELELPHPRMKERAFVLVPLAELAPELELDGERVDRRAAALGEAGLRRLGPLETLTE